MRNILLTISYDGTDFCGWQRQDRADGGRPVRTVQGELEAVLSKMHKEQVSLHGSGRTDSGVHAAAQAANFLSPVDSIPAERYPLALNSLLPRDIRVMGAREVPQDFSARFSATNRTYRYFFCPGNKIPLATQTPYLWHLPFVPDIENLNSMASVLSGETDCATFAAAGDQSASTRRYIERARFFFQDGLLVFEIRANAFLWKMVRSLAGTLVSLDRRGLGAQDFAAALASRDRKAAGPTAPACGLFLWSVEFDGIRRHK